MISFFLRFNHAPQILVDVSWNDCVVKDISYYIEIDFCLEIMINLLYKGI